VLEERRQYGPCRLEAQCGNGGQRVDLVRELGTLHLITFGGDEDAAGE